jgi:hypothetical protein
MDGGLQALDLDEPAHEEREHHGQDHHGRAQPNVGVAQGQGRAAVVRARGAPPDEAGDGAGAGACERAGAAGAGRRALSGRVPRGVSRSGRSLPGRSRAPRLWKALAALAAVPAGPSRLAGCRRAGCADAASPPEALVAVAADPRIRVGLAGRVGRCAWSGHVTPESRPERWFTGPLPFAVLREPERPRCGVAGLARPCSGAASACARRHRLPVAVAPRGCRAAARVRGFVGVPAGLAAGFSSLRRHLAASSSRGLRSAAWPWPRVGRRRLRSPSTRLRAG